MTLPPHRALRQPHAALADVCDGFFDGVAFVADCPRLERDELPPLARRLLAHREHMTRVLAEHYGAPITLRVLREESGANHYARMIVLSRGEGGPVVEFGIVRMDLGCVAPDVRAEILAKSAPLGDILIRHNVLRRISPRWYFRFPPTTPIARAFGGDGVEAFGRVGMIYCDEEPAIELLEVVAPG